MNKLKKVGLTALAGSLAAVSAHAAELTVTGSATLSYLSHDQQNSVDSGRFGSSSDMGFNASGEVNGYTVSWMNQLSDTATVSSHTLTIDMGEMGSLRFDQGAGGNGFGSIDDKSPTAWEESWDGMGTGNSHTIAGNQSTNTFKYSNTIMGVSINAAYDPTLNDVDSGDGAGSSGTTGTAGGHGSSTGVALSTTVLLDGLDIGAGFGKDTNDDTSAFVKDLESWGAYANYTFGPATVGYSMTETSGGISGHGMNQVSAYGVVMAINENLSVSWNEHTNSYVKSGSNANVDQESTGIAIAYTMGGASLKIQNNEQKNAGGVTTAKTNENTEISLSLAF